jgi:NAD(P)-dependent dehydrogenase (short-subunit alcohol dehydrogenase family)
MPSVVANARQAADTTANAGIAETEARVRLDDQVVVVTGAAGTIGREVCRVLGNAGAWLAVTDVDGTGLGDLCAELTDAGVKNWGLAADGAALGDFETFLTAARADLGPVSGLVNVAGTFRIVDFVESGPADWDAMISSNLITVLVACRAVLPGMIDRGAGSIVNFASTAGEYGSIRPSAAYAAAKAGVIGLTKSLAREVSPAGVRVNAISPGPVNTPALQAASPEQAAAAAARTLLGRVGAPSDIAFGVRYLLSSESAFVTGTVLQVNGGSLL